MYDSSASLSAVPIRLVKFSSVKKSFFPVFVEAQETEKKAHAVMLNNNMVFIDFINRFFIIVQSSIDRSFYDRFIHYSEKRAT